MRINANDEDVFRLMDQKEHYLIGAGICSVAAVAAGLVLGCGAIKWDWVYLLCISVIGAAVCFCRIQKIDQRIMEASHCFLELENDSLVVCQPEKNSHYEICRIFYEEIEKIVEGSQRGNPELYIVLRNNLEHRQSFILLDQKEQDRLIFCVRSLGYKKEAFRQFYQKLRWKVPGKVHIFGTKYQEIWDMKRKNPEIIMISLMVLLYVVPKIIVGIV